MCLNSALNVRGKSHAWNVYLLNDKTNNRRRRERASIGNFAKYELGRMLNIEPTITVSTVHYREVQRNC